MVVLYGNQAQGQIHTKPGQATFGKNMTGPRVYKPEWENRPVVPLPFFDQTDVSEHMMENALKKVQVIFDKCCQEVQDAISGDFLVQFLHVG